MLESLHAKCYSNEKTAIVSSMNLLDVSQQKNWEMGFKIDHETDPDVFNEVKKYVEDIWNEGKQFQYSIKKIDDKSAVQKKSYGTSKFTIKAPSSQMVGTGFCIRCGVKMEVNPSRPLCSKCYPIWANYSDPKYEENYCHVCGKESKQSVEKPVCYSCYKKLYK